MYYQHCADKRETVLERKQFQQYRRTADKESPLQLTQDGSHPVNSPEGLGLQSLSDRAWKCSAEAWLEWQRRTLPRQEITWASTQEGNGRPTYWVPSPAIQLYVSPSFFLSFIPILLTQL